MSHEAVTRSTPASPLVAHTKVTEEPIEVAQIVATVGSPAAGATVTFSGDVRDHDGGKQVTHLTYEAHPSANQVLRAVAHEVAARHDVISVAVVHRVGALAIGDAALIVAVSAAHRGPAFAACADLVDTTKARLPVWKHQVFSDGTQEWVNCA